MTISYIYALRDPQTMQVRWIGCTRNPKQRLQCHLSAPAAAGNLPRHSWISALKGAGLVPIFEILETVYGNAASSERRWIAEQKPSGMLLNIARGGGGRSAAISPSDLARVIAMGRRGAAQREIAEAVGLSQARVSQLLAGRGKRTRPPGIEARERAIRQAAKKTPVTELAERYGVSRARIYQILAGG